jgi:FkbM family methyltransferase
MGKVSMNVEINMPRFIDLVNARFGGQIRTVFEVGSLDGKDARIFEKHFPEAAVYAIEGLHSNVVKYMTHLKGVTAIERVICDYDGFANFFEKTVNGIHSIHDRGAAYGTNASLLPCNRLDTLCKELGVTSIDMLKIDAEGTTYEVLKGLGELWSTVKIMHVETEDFPFFQGQKLHKEVVELLASNGFEMIELSAAEITPGCFQHDSVWVKK